MTQNAFPHSDSCDTSVHDVSRNRLQKLLIALSKRTKGFIQASRESQIAKRTCAFYLGKHNKDTHHVCQRVLQTRLRLRPSQLVHFLESSLGTDMLKRVGTLFHWSNEDDSHHTLKELLVNAATEPEGLSIPSLLNKITAFPLNMDQVLLTTSRFEQLLQTTRVMVKTIRSLADAEIEQTAMMTTIASRDEAIASRLPSTQGSDQQALHRLHAESPESCSAPLTRLEAGNYDIQQRVLTLHDYDRDRTLRVLAFMPKPCRKGCTPVVVMSHGLGATPEDMRGYAEFLTSHGYVVVALQHPGSDASYVRKMLNGHSHDVFQHTDFIDRPLDVTFFLNYLNQHRSATYGGLAYGGRLNLRSVGVMGHSFGGYTAFALAGGALNFDKLESACGPVFNAPNLSLFLQCRALGLPRMTYDLCDRRVQAIFVLDSVGSELFGRKGLHHIDIPVFLIAGSDDRTTPAVLEQIRLFPWLNSPHRYLGLIEGKSHVGDLRKLMTVLDLDVELPKEFHQTDTIFLDDYIKTLSTAFFEVYIAQNAAYQTHLTSNYAHSISQDSYPLSVISATSSTSLESALETIGAQLVADCSEYAAQRDAGNTETGPQMPTTHIQQNTSHEGHQGE